MIMMNERRKSFTNMAYGVIATLHKSVIRNQVSQQTLSLANLFILLYGNKTACKSGGARAQLSRKAPNEDLNWVARVCPGLIATLHTFVFI